MSEVVVSEMSSMTAICDRYHIAQCCVECGATQIRAARAATPRAATFILTITALLGAAGVEDEAAGGVPVVEDSTTTVVEEAAAVDSVTELNMTEDAAVDGVVDPTAGGADVSEPGGLTLDEAAAGGVVLAGGALEAAGGGTPVVGELEAGGPVAGVDSGVDSGVVAGGAGGAEVSEPGGGAVVEAAGVVAGGTGGRVAMVVTTERGVGHEVTVTGSFSAAQLAEFNY